VPKENQKYSPVCRERQRLMMIYSDAVGAQATAMQGYKFLSGETERVRAAIEVARLALQRHIDEHQCAPEVGP